MGDDPPNASLQLQDAQPVESSVRQRCVIRAATPAPDPKVMADSGHKGGAPRPTAGVGPAGRRRLGTVVLYTVQTVLWSAGAGFAVHGSRPLPAERSANGSAHTTASIPRQQIRPSVPIHDERLYSTWQGFVTMPVEREMSRETPPGGP